MSRIIINVASGDVSEIPLTAEEQAEVQAQAAAQAAVAPVREIQRIEETNPITHRALRELILTIGEIYPAGKNTVFYQRVLAAEQAIQAERAKL